MISNKIQNRKIKLSNRTHSRKFSRKEKNMYIKNIKINSAQLISIVYSN